MEPARTSITKQLIAKEIHAPARRNYKRRHVKILGFKDLFQADLVEMIEHSNVNNGYRYILTVIDVFSKYAWARPVLRKSGENVSNAMRDILTTTTDRKPFLKPPKFLQTDAGKEFYNRQFQNMLHEFGITLYSTHSVKKASVIERFNRTLKTKMWVKFSAQGTFRWIDLLPRLILDYNSSIHRTIKIKPRDVKRKDERMLQEIHFFNHRLPRRGKVKFNIGDHVRINSIKGIFEKGYEPNWSTGIFTIAEICPTAPVTYKLQDYLGNPIPGGFYNEELRKTDFHDIYLVEKIVKRRGNRVLVKWLGFPNSHNTWEDEQNIIL